MSLSDKTLAQRFHAKWRADASGCWVWTAALDRHGYGRIQYGRAKTLKAHRVAYELHKGIVPAGLMVCHTCDVRACVNPAHLYAGTAQDNVGDCLRRGRYRPGGKPHYGEDNCKAKLTREKVLEIRALAAQMTQRELALRFGVNASSVGRIIRREHWAHV